MEITGAEEGGLDGLAPVFDVVCDAVVVVADSLGGRGRRRFAHEALPQRLGQQKLAAILDQHLERVRLAGLEHGTARLPALERGALIAALERWRNKNTLSRVKPL